MVVLVGVVVGYGVVVVGVCVVGCCVFWMLWVLICICVVRLRIFMLRLSSFGVVLCWVFLVCWCV